MCGVALTKTSPLTRFQNKSKITWQKSTISAISWSPLPDIDANPWPQWAGAAANSAALADGRLTWQEWMINGREEARVRVDEVMLSS